MVIDDVGTWVVEQDDGPCATENKCLWLKKTKYLFTCTFFDESSRPNIEVDVDFLDTGPRTSASREGATEQGVQGSNHLGTRVPNDPASYAPGAIAPSLGASQRPCTDHQRSTNRHSRPFRLLSLHYGETTGPSTSTHCNLFLRNTTLSQSSKS